MITIAVCQFSVARSSPADVFSIPAPVIGSDPPKATDLEDGDATVSTQTGALQYSYPIQVPPGRNGAAPALSLNYSSQGSIYGTTAAGWSLSIPTISGDTSKGRLRTEAPEASVGIYTAYGADDRFVSSLAGGQRLIPSPDPIATDVWMTYRADGDTSFARYERLKQDVVPYRWRVLQTDGSILEFGFGSVDASGCPRTDSYAPLRRMRDAFGNEVSYEYAFASGECYLSRIVYGQNPGASLGSFASVDFDVKPGNTCSGVIVGSQTDYRFGLPITTGANKLNKITVKAYDPAAPSVAVHTRTITFGYSDVDERCPETDQAMRAGVRLLTSIQETASGTDSPEVTMPKLTFGYGPIIADLTTGGVLNDEPWPVGLNETAPRQNLGWGYRRASGDDRWPTVEAMMLDVDGDGLVDRVTNATVTVNGVTTCQAAWRRNTSHDGTLSFSPVQDLSFGATTNKKMPMLRWQGANEYDPNGSQQAYPDYPQFEGCALNGQVTAFHNSHPASGTPNPRTYLAYRWMDMDGDGLPDLVAAVHGSSDRYDIIRGNDVAGGGPYEPPLFGTVSVPGGFPSCSGTPPEPCKALGSTCMLNARRNCDPADPLCSVQWSDGNTCVAQAADDECYLHTGSFLASAGPPGTSPNPGNLPPPSAMVAHRQPYRMCNNLYPWFIFKNRGNGNFNDQPVIKYQPVPLESDTGDSALTGAGVAATSEGVLDIDGDGLLDGIARARDADQEAKAFWWYVWPNDGTGSLGPKRYVWTGRVDAAINGSLVPTGSSLFGAMGLFDINGDGLVDHWTAPDPDFNNPDAFTNVSCAPVT